MPFLERVIFRFLRGAVAALASHLEAPGGRLSAHVSQVDEGAALPEATLHVGDEPLRVRLIPGPPHPGGVNPEG